MNKIIKSRAGNMTRIMIVLVAVSICLSMAPGFKTEARANGGAFVGGMIAGHVVGGAIRRDRVRTAAAVETANQSRTVQQAAPAPAPAAKPTSKQKLDELDKLAAGGYITPDEYKAKKKAILDSM
jgi:hypothetical protein